jgi:hypothetical protein
MILSKVSQQAGCGLIGAVHVAIVNWLSAK